MEKLESYTRNVYDIFEVLDFVDNKIKGFRDQMWDILCEYNYIHNDTFVDIPFITFIEEAEEYSSIICEGLNIIKTELSYILESGTIFQIYW